VSIVSINKLMQFTYTEQLILHTLSELKETIQLVHRECLGVQIGNQSIQTVLQSPLQLDKTDSHLTTNCNHWVGCGPR